MLDQIGNLLNHRNGETESGNVDMSTTLIPLMPWMQS